MTARPARPMRERAEASIETEEKREMVSIWGGGDIYLFVF